MTPEKHAELMDELHRRRTVATKAHDKREAWLGLIGIVPVLPPIVIFIIACLVVW